MTTEVTVPSALPLAIETENLTKVFGKRTVVDNLSIKVPSACVAAFVGPNGAGKSTTLRMLLGLLRPTSGTATVLGADIADLESYLSLVGSLIEGPSFYPGLSGRRNLEVLVALGNLRSEHIDEVLELVGLDQRGGDRVAKYSLGMKQRLGLAAALLPEPSLLVLDEPANGLDPTGIAAMRTLLRKIADLGITVLVSSHQLSELEQIADWVIMINQGTLKYQGKMDPLLGNSGSTVVSPERPEDLARLIQALAKAGFEPVTAGAGEVEITLGEKTAADVNRLAGSMGIVLAELHTRQSTLEDVYFSMTDRGSIA